VQQVAEHQAGGAGADDANLRAGGGGCRHGQFAE
jgi:hypothetical protein